ncbi:hypothetical protein G5S47_03860 [Schaalia turicensis]|nr:hypothetical protein G5S47_03860 [Schaalia turicensis]
MSPGVYVARATALLVMVSNSTGVSLLSLRVAALPRHDHRLDTCEMAEPPHAPFADLVAEVVQIIGQNSVAAFGVVFVELAQRPDEVFLLDLARGSRGFQPLIVGLFTEAKYPARHRDRHPNPGSGRGQLSDERVDHFGGVIRAFDR